MFQDSRGYIWVGTHYGVAYFNGVRFQSITPKDGLPYASVQQIQEDIKGNIWFYTGKWFCKYDGQKITYDTTKIRVKDGRFFIDKSGTAWCVNTLDSFLYKSINFKNWECVSCNNKSLLKKKWNALQYDKIRDRILLRDLTEHLFIYTKDNLIPILPKGVWFQHIGLSSCNIEFGTVADSIFLLKEDKVNFIKKTNNIGAVDVIQRPNGKLYFVKYFGKNLYTFNDKNGIDSFPLNVSATNLLFEDKDRNVWIGTEEGLLRVYTEGFTNFDKTKLNSIWSMVEDTEGGMWFGSYYDKTTIWHFKNRKLDSIKADKSINSKPIKYGSNNDFGHFYFGGGRDVSGNIYFPMYWGIMKYDGKKFSALDKATSPEPISMFFHIDREKNLLVSGTRGGVNVVDLQTRATKYYGADKGMHRTGYVLGVGQDKNNNYWLGTPTGIGKLDLSRDSIIKNYTRDLKNFPHYGIHAVFGDPKGNIWAGCSQGLLRYDANRDTFVLVADNIIRASVNALGAYKDKYLVATASDGIYFLDLQAFYTEGDTIVRCFNQHNGYLGIEPNQNCLYVDSKDNIWVAASDIVTKITPSELNMMSHPLTPYITQINDSLISYQEYNKFVQLPHGINTTKIRFEAVGFERPFNTKFRYKVGNNQWSKWRVEDFAVLDNLASGEYTFYVQTRPAGTVDEKDIKETSIRFYIDIPFYKQPYFPLVAAFLLIGLGFGSWWIYNRQQKRHEDANKKHQEVIEQRKRLELLNTEMSHRVRNNLNMMQQIMSMQARRVKNEEAKKVLNEGVDRIQAMAILHNHLIAYNESESLSMKDYIEELCEKVKESYSEDISNLRFNIDIGNLRLDEIFGRHIGLTVSELLTNSIKHAFSKEEKPLISIRLYEVKNVVWLEYQDNGKGIPDDFDIRQTSSLGMKLIYGISERFKGKIKFDNRNGLHCQIVFEKRTK
jgi:two-component sensor histidine kinase/ligand-binding sensor domain-containing protein